MHDRIQRHAALKSCRRIAQPIGRPRMSHFVDGEGEQQNDELDENPREVDVWQRITLCGECRE